MRRMTNLFFMNIHRVLFTAMFVCFTMLVVGQEASSGKCIKPDPDRYRAYMPGYEVVDIDTSKWYPKEFYIIYPDKKITFKFPYEEEQSGVRNMLFINKKTGQTYLLDEECPPYEYRKFTKFDSEKHDVVLLYNNGTYIRYNDMIFENKGCMEIDMTQSDIQPYSSESVKWLTMRAFNEVIGNAKRKRKIKGNTTICTPGVEIRGYVFGEEGYRIPWLFIFSNSNYSDSTLLTVSEDDGYFLVESNDTSQPLNIPNGQMYISCEITITIDCGIFVVLARNPDLDPNMRFGGYSGFRHEQ